MNKISEIKLLLLYSLVKFTWKRHGWQQLVILSLEKKRSRFARSKKFVNWRIKELNLLKRI